MKRGLILCATLLLAGAAQAQPKLAVTFDDLPAHGPLPPGESRLQVAQQVIAALKGAGAPPTYGFVNGARETEEPASAAVLDAWRAAGFPLGNHAWSHMDLDAHSATAFEADVARNEPLLQKQMGGADWRWFRYPYLNAGDTPSKRGEVRRFLAQRGYRIAGVTMGFSDWAFNEPYARCLARSDKAAVARLEGAYLQAAAAEAARSRRTAQALYGRDIPYVLLMHIGAFDGRMATRLLAQYRQEGFRFVDLPTAERDPFYAGELNPGGADGPDSLEAALRARGVTPEPSPDLTWLDGICR